MLSYFPNYNNVLWENSCQDNHETLFSALGFFTCKVYNYNGLITD